MEFKQAHDNLIANVVEITSYAYVPNETKTFS